MTDEKRIQEIVKILQKVYPTAHIMLTFTTPWELLVAVILSAQCTDKMVNTVTPTLFATYKTIYAFSSAKPKEVEVLIKKTGFYRNKTRHIIESAKAILTRFHGEVPHTMEELLTIPGVARKTANVVLSNAWNVSEGIAVDTHVIRLSQRLRLIDITTIGGKITRFINDDHKMVDFIKDANPEKIEARLMSLLPKHLWNIITYQLIDHGRAVCKAQNPLCHSCPLSSLCPSYRIHT